GKLHTAIDRQGSGEENNHRNGSF
uniref:Movement protein n=1 Tax=Globodera pallida TaxID=36090 RepID=A0A183CSA1_GLOPA